MLLSYAAVDVPIDIDDLVLLRISNDDEDDTTLFLLPDRLDNSAELVTLLLLPPDVPVLVTRVLVC